MDIERINAKLNNYDERIKDVSNAIREVRDEFLKEAMSFQLDVNCYAINRDKGFAHAPIHIAGNNHTLEEAKEFHRQFGILLELAEKIL